MQTIATQLLPWLLPCMEETCKPWLKLLLMHIIRNDLGTNSVDYVKSVPVANQCSVKVQNVGHKAVTSSYYDHEASVQRAAAVKKL